MSAGLYVHIPFCASKCAYCSFVSGAYPAEIKEQYVDCVLRELRERAGEVAAVDTVFFGGGTPGQLSISLFEKLTDGIFSVFDPSAVREFTFETNPETVTDEYVRTLVAHGVNRVSLGLQSTSDKLLSIIGRRHTYGDFVRAVRILRAHGVVNISCDLMLGLPEQTLSDVKDAVQAVASLGLEHVSVYALKVEQGTLLFGYEPDDDLVADMYELAVGQLRENGYFRYETSNFCRPGYECKHNLKYWQMQDYLGVGVAAHSYTRGERRANVESVHAYLAGKAPSIDHQTPSDKKREYVMLALRLEKGMELSDYTTQFGADFLQERKDEIASLQKIGCITVADGHVFIPPARAFVANSIIVRLID